MGENVLVSPLSISLALALVLAGATPSSTCESEFMSVLKISSHADIPKLGSLLSSSHGGVQLTTANSVWTRASILPSYVSVASDTHSAEARKLPTDYAPIDEWVSDKTNGLIKNMLSGPIDPLTVALLVNAVHFKGIWKDKFDEELTKEGTFESPGGKREARFMYAERRMGVALAVKELGGATVVRLDYDSGEKPAEYCALFVLPAKSTKKSMEAVIAGLKTTPLGNLMDKLGRETVRLFLPRFRVSYGVKSLKEHLQTLGIKSAFIGKEVFSSMSDDPDVHLDDVLHKAVMEVTEEGTVAAAATAAIMMTRSFVPQEPWELRFDRPFAMCVVHVRTGTPVFVGRFDDPELIF